MRSGIACLVAVALAACGGADAPKRSAPVEPTVQLGDPDGLGLKTAGELEGLVSSDAPALPDVFGALELGQAEAEARRTLVGLHDARLPPPDEVELGGYRILGIVLAEYGAAGVSGIFDMQRGVLHELDLSLPSDQALWVFSQAWGPPDMQSDPKLGPMAVWTNPATGLRVELTQAGQGKGIAKFRKLPAAPASPEAAEGR